jgi:hypothetical protein
MLLALLLPLTPATRAQTGAATARLTGQVSGAVALSVHEARDAGARTQTSIERVDATTAAVTISGHGGGERRVSLRLRLRSNVGYGLDAARLSTDETGVRISVAGVRATGRFVHADALDGMEAAEAAASPPGARAASLPIQSRRPPVRLLSGPPVSSAGTFSSPDNAVEVVLSVEIEPRPEAEGWSTRLTITAAPRR